jgi:hypothetical protein
LDTTWHYDVINLVASILITSVFMYEVMGVRKENQAQFKEDGWKEE